MTIDIAILLAAIAAVESNTNDAAIGAKGERGRYQITRAVWERWMPQPEFPLGFGSWWEVGAHNPSLARWVADREIRYHIITELEKAGRVATAFAVAACWNVGVTGYIKHNQGAEYAWKVGDEYARRMK